MVNNCSKRNSNWEIDDWMVRTEVKISMKKKYSACLYFQLLITTLLNMVACNIIPTCYPIKHESV